MDEIITSTANKQVKNLIALQTKGKERRAQKAFVVEGEKLVCETPKELLQAVYVSENYKGSRDFSVPVVTFSESVFKAASDTQTPQGIMAIVRKPAYEMEEILAQENPLCLILEDIQDPGNLGTMIRTGEGAGVSCVIMSKNTVDLFHPKTVRATMGSIYRVPFFVSENLPDTLRMLKEKGISLYAAHLKGNKAYDAFDYCKGTGFLIGNEGNGLSDEIADMADTYIRIPMEGQLESLNAAVSAALLMYETHRQRSK